MAYLLVALLVERMGALRVEGHGKNIHNLQMWA